MEQFTVKQGQNLFDVVLTLYGDMGGIGNFMQLNPSLSFNSALKDGDVVNYDPAKAIDEVNINYLSKKKIVACNGARNVYYKDVSEPIFARIYIKNTVVSTSFKIKGVGDIQVDWGDNSDIEHIKLNEFNSYEAFHEMNSNIDGYRKISIYGNPSINEFDISSIDPYKIHFFQDVYIENFIAKRNTHLSDIGFIKIPKTITNIDMSSSKVNSLIPLVHQERLRSIILKDCNIKSRVLDEYFIAIVKQYQSRLKANVYISGNEPPSGEYKAPAIFSDPKNGMEAIWILENDQDRLWKIHLG